MATFDIFNDDAFGVSQLTSTIVDIPRVQTRLGDSGLFTEYGIRTTSMMIERKGSSLTLVPAAPRGGVGEPVTLDGRSLINLNTIHLPQTGAVMADEVQGIRAFGSETEVMAAQDLVRDKLVKMKAQLDVTLEYHRIGAVKGQVLDADGTTVLLDVYSAFGMAQQTQFMALATSTTKVKQLVIQIKRKIAAALGGRSFTRVKVLCSQSFFDDLTGHAAVEKAFELYNQNSYAREDQSGTSFEFAGVVFEEYAGGIGTHDFIPDGLAYAYPEGVSGLFQTAFAPADYMETVNTKGLPYYAKQELMGMNKGVKLESQSNPLNFCSLPEAVIKVSAAAS
jgi:hypothetical protein